ncbi:MAG TPA: 4-(cytidine 5'-diphospho)-2-C-methyl-D-erythritol kinase [Candidatus Binatia bacterium]|nr:4-(cytidine 5'-diphospho)-2-C-methyl-D-erythritol kinase [Candidatus Binatia bacterium]
MKIRAPAKVNLFLRVLGRRRDGYHLLDTLIVPVSLYDDIEIRRLPAKPQESANPRITIACDNPAVPPGEENLAYRAAQLLLEQVDRRTSVHIYIQKRIPLGAGLGGGSTDAAATLLGFNRLFKLNLSAARLERLALRLGADVPFFIRARPARAHGIGEKLRPVRGLVHFWLVILYPGFPVATGSVYKKLPKKLTKSTPGNSIATFLKRFDRLPDLLVNDLESVTLESYPKIQSLKEKLLREGAAGGLMSGSGSSVFGVFGSKGLAQRAFDRLRNEEGVQAYLVHVLNR